MADVEALKVELRSRLVEIMDGYNANQTIGLLDNNMDELVFVAQQIDVLIKKLKPMYRLGMPSKIFMGYIRNMMRDEMETKERVYLINGDSSRQRETIRLNGDPDLKRKKSSSDEEEEEDESPIEYNQIGSETEGKREEILSYIEKYDSIPTTNRREGKYTKQTLPKSKKIIDELYDKMISDEFATDSESRVMPDNFGGKGVKKPKKDNIMIGFGVKVNRKEVDVDTSKKVKAREVYVPFGRYLLNQNKLGTGILMMRTKKGGAIPKHPTKKVSKDIQVLFQGFLDGKMPSFDDINDLSETDKDKMYSVLTDAQVDKISVPQPDKCKVDRENRRFELLRGEILAGNDNADMVKEFKLLILKLMNKSRLPRREGQEILVELTSMGY